jgi:TolB protein
VVYASSPGENRESILCDLANRRQVNLSNNPAPDWAPHWSPDGKQIAFLSDRDGDTQVYVMNADGSNPHAVSGGIALDSHPAWRPR